MKTAGAIKFSAHGARGGCLNMPKQPFSLSNQGVRHAGPSAAWGGALLVGRPHLDPDTPPKRAGLGASAPGRMQGVGPGGGAAVHPPSGHSVSAKHHTRTARSADRARSFLGDQLGPGAPAVPLLTVEYPPSVKADAPGVQNHGHSTRIVPAHLDSTANRPGGHQKSAQACGRKPDHPGTRAAPTSRR